MTEQLNWTEDRTHLLGKIWNHVVHTPPQRNTHRHRRTPPPTHTAIRTPATHTLFLPRPAISSEHQHPSFQAFPSSINTHPQWGDGQIFVTVMHVTTLNVILYGVTYISRLLLDCGKTPLFGLWIKGKEECHLVGVSVMTTATSDLGGFPSTSENRSAVYTSPCNVSSAGGNWWCPLQFFYLRWVILWASIFTNDQYPIKSVIEDY